MRTLVWADGRGLIARGTQRMTLLAPPALPFAFQALDFCDDDAAPRAQRLYAGGWRALDVDERAACAALCETLAGANAARVVHGADTQGRYLGLVDEAACAHVLDGPPPFDAAEAQFDPVARQWRRVLGPARRALLARAERNARLRACDWTQAPDAPLAAAKRAEWQAYRQALRDLPAHPSWPDLAAADWPVEPA